MTMHLQFSRRSAAGALAAVALTCVSVTAQVLDPAVPGRAIVRVQPGVSIGTVIGELAAQLPGITLTVDDPSLSDRGIYLLAYEPAVPADQIEPAFAALEDDPDNATSLWGELLYEGSDPEGRTGSVWFFTVGGSTAYAQQYATSTLALPAAARHSTGAGAVVAVLDTGMDASHPMLAANVLPGGFNFLTDDDDTSDANGHGTFVAGLIRLVAPDVGLLPVTVLDADGKGDAWALARGLFYAIDQGVEVINLSLGSTYKSSAVEDAMAEAESLGIVVVAAGGNQNAGEEGEEFPAAGSDGFGVAAVDDADVKAAFSNYNDKFFISAPGTSAPQPGEPDGYDPDRTIYSALPGGAYGIWEGTSFATAFVSGAAALARDQLFAAPDTVATYDAVQARLAASAVDISAANPGFDGLLGVGRLDVGGAALMGAGDLNADGQIGVVDLLAMLGAWGPCAPGPCPGDLDGDGAVGVVDLLIILGNWD